jgi:hypothetical protein
MSIFNNLRVAPVAFGTTGHYKAALGPLLAKFSVIIGRAALHSLIHSGLFQAASAFRKTFNLKGRNFRFE